MRDPAKIEKDYEDFVTAAEEKTGDALALAHGLWCFDHFGELADAERLLDNLSMNRADAAFRSAAIELRLFALMLTVEFYIERDRADSAVPGYLAEIRTYGELLQKRTGDIFFLAVSHLLAVLYSRAEDHREEADAHFQAYDALVRQFEDPPDLALIASYAAGVDDAAFLAAARERIWVFLNDQVSCVRREVAAEAESRAVKTAAIAPVLGADAEALRKLAASLEGADLETATASLERFAMERDPEGTSTWVDKATRLIDVLCPSMRDNPDKLPAHLRVDDRDIDILKKGARITPLCRLIFPWEKECRILADAADFRSWASHGLYGFLGLGMLGQDVPQEALAEALASIAGSLPKPILKDDLYRLHEIMKIVLFFRPKNPDDPLAGMDGI
jgi:hypothetical protein